MCGEDIQSVICEQVCVVHYPMHIKIKILGGYEYGPADIKEVFDDYMTVFLCPACEDVITDDEDSAYNFLSGKAVDGE
jgi:hypothetical protein